MHKSGEPSQLVQPSGWPTLPDVAAWQDTRDTVQLWTQIVGKVRLALAPMLNHWWQVPLYVSSRGLTTSLMHAAGLGLEIEFDFLEHVVVVRTSDGGERRVELAPRSVADFHAATMAALRELGVNVDILARPVEIARAIPFDEDTEHCSYDPDAIQRFWLALVQAHRVLSQFRAGFLGKASPVRVFYAYAYPTPAGFADWDADASYDHHLGEFLLPYTAVRTAEGPDAVLLDFLQRTYEAAAELGGWDRAALEARQ